MKLEEDLKIPIPTNMIILELKHVNTGLVLIIINLVHGLVTYINVHQNLTTHFLDFSQGIEILPLLCTMIDVMKVTWTDIPVNMKLDNKLEDLIFVKMNFTYPLSIVFQVWETIRGG